MALFIVRPSRGSWIFFGLVALSALAARGYEHHERTVDRRDGPLAATAIELGRCVLGDVETITAERTAPDALAIWTHRTADRLRVLASAPQDGGWPNQCALIADRLAMRLSSQAGHSARTIELAHTVAYQLQNVGHDGTSLVNLADNDAFAEQLAALFMQVRTLSDRATEHWDRLPVPAAATDLAHPTVLDFERFRPVAPGWERMQIVGPDAVYFYARGSATTVRASFTNREFSGVALGVPVLDGWHGEALRVENNDGPMFVTPRGLEPARVTAFPTAMAHGSERFDAWEVASTSTTQALLSTDLGTVRLRTSPIEGALVWTPPVTIGPQESALVAVVAPEPEDTGERFRVSVLRPRIDDAWLEQYVVTLRPALPSPAAPSARPTVANAPATSPTGEHSVGVDALAGMTLEVGPPTMAASGVVMFGGRIATCASGSVRYLAIHADRNTSELSVLRIDGDEVTVTHAAANIPRERPWVFTCDVDRALIETDPSVPRRGVFLAEFPRFAGASLALLEPPLVGPSPRVEALALMTDAVVAVTSNHATLRTWRLPRGEREWAVQGLIGLLDQTSRPLRTVRHIDAVASGSVLALRIEGTETPIPPPPPPGTDENHPAPPPPPPVAYTALSYSTDNAVHFRYR